MDPVGEIFREYLKQTHSNVVRNAVALGHEFKGDGMTRGQVREMLYASGFDKQTVEESLASLFPDPKARG